MARFPLNLARRIGHRGTALLFFGFVDLVYAISLANPPTEARRSMTLAYVASIASLTFWSLLWLVVGLVCIVGAFLRQDRW